jgi:aldehyde:ferredoxin oxidoreductase
MHDAYYKYYGWDDNGIPTEETLKSLGLEYLVDDVRQARKNL